MSVLRPISPVKCGITAPGFVFCTSVDKCDSATQAVPNPSSSASSTCSKKFSSITRSDGRYPCTSVWQMEKKMSYSMFSGREALGAGRMGRVLPRPATRDSRLAFSEPRDHRERPDLVVLRGVVCGVDLEPGPRHAGADRIVHLRFALRIEQRRGDSFELIDRSAPFDRMRGIAPDTGAQCERDLRREEVFAAEVQFGDVLRLIAARILNARRGGDEVVGEVGVRHMHRIRIDGQHRNRTD